MKLSLNPLNVGASLLLVLPGLSLALPAIAQSLPECQPPGASEYVLLVTSQTADDQSRLEQVLPSGATITPCLYLGQSVIRVSTFASEDLARSWAEYLTTVEGFQAAVARPPDEAPEPPQNGTSQPGTPSTSTYDPVALEPGYAVLVRYFNRPQVAAAVQSALNASVGLAVYEQEPYLLAAYTTDPVVAGRVLQGLSDRQFSTFIVNSRQVVLLTPTVTIPQRP